MTGLKLLIVDDEEYIRIPLKDYFEDCGWTVDVFSSAHEAIEYLGGNSASCAIVDMRLPGMTGIEFIKKAVSIQPGIKFVIYTGSIDFEVTDDLRSAGIDENNIVRKPASELGELLRAAERSLKKG